MTQIINLKNIKFLVGNKKLEKVSVSPYDDMICNFLSDLSKDLNKSEEVNLYPDVKALAFFCRKSHIERLKKISLNPSDQLRFGLGMIFHITPSNIPTNFAYSLIFGLLTGNSNIVKVPSREFKQVDIICHSINKLLKKYKFLKKMIKIIRYNDNDSFTKEISSKCNARLIWGGDNSIQNIRNFTLNTSAIDLTFADRYSFCAINSEKLLKLKSSDLQRLVEKFYIDTFVVDQNACSSPHLIVWLGDKKLKAKSLFWNKLSQVVNQKYDLTHIASMDKYTELCKKILSDKNVQKFKTYSNNIYTISLKKFNKNLDSYRGKWGFFYEHDIKNLDHITDYVNKKFQTLTYFGFKKKYLENFIIKNNLNGIDRIVPIGQALDIGFFWDGYDINKILTRVVDIK